VTHIDEALIQRLYSPLSGWATHRLGLDQWRLSLECLNGHIAFYIAGVALTIAGKGAYDGIFTNMLVALAWLLIMEIVRRVAQRQAGSSMGVQSARLGEWHFRTIGICMLPVSLFYVEAWSNACYTVSLFLLVSHLYFKACDTPPPEPRGRLARSRA
jgi:hypothetical protein